ncbi:periplasmic nitrate reductase, NapE protein [Amphritea sp. HPY]|uniref:periplasmic nitrate reductase, NapE protein n=1 Tax=Amphritea sp. HPY TaxID=3421652 RepID=UPI003D7C6604
MSNTPPTDEKPSLFQESKAFLLITAVLLPLLTVTLIAGYGFTVWFSQLLLGPPGH